MEHPYQNIKHAFKAMSLFILSLCMLFLITVPVQAQNEQKTVRVVVVPQDGLVEVGEDGSLSGYSIDYLDLVAQYENWDLEYQVLNNMDTNDAISLSMDRVMNGEADLVGAMLYADGMEKYFCYPERNYGISYQVLLASNSNADVTSLNYMNISPLRVAVLSSASSSHTNLHNYLDSIGVTYEEVACDNLDGQYDALNNGSADVMLTNTVNFSSNTKEICRFKPTPYYFVTTLGNDALMDEMDDAIYQISSDSPNFASQLYEKYFGSLNTTFSLTSSDLAYFSDKQELNVLVGTNCSPYSYTKDGKVSGVSALLLQDFASKVNVKINYTYWSTQDELNTLLADNTYDCVIGPTDGLENCASLGYINSTCYMDTEYVSFRKPNTSTSDTSTLRLALTRGTNLEGMENQYGSVQYYDNVATCVSAVTSSKADVGIADSSAVEYITTRTFANLTTVQVPDQTIHHSIYVSRDSSEIIGVLNRYISSLSDKELNSYFLVTSSENTTGSLAYFMHTDPIAFTVACAALVAILLILIFAFLKMRSDRTTNMQLQTANQAKTDFLSRVSHDMRTPLNGIIGLAGLAKNKDDINDLKEDMAQIESNSHYLLSLVNDTLDVSRVEKGLMDLHPIVCSSKAFYQTLFALFKPNLDAKKLHLITHIEPVSDAMYYVDSGRVEQIYMNIVGNAIKFSNEGGTIEIWVDEIEDDASHTTEKVTITDNGIGISKEFLPHVFEPFAQEHTGNTAQYQGTGLGMAIVKKILDLMHGTISVSSTQGIGTTFTFTLPLPKATAEQIEEVNKLTAEELDPDSVLYGKRILLCEDNELNAKITEAVLAKKGILVDTVTNGKEGLDQFESTASGYYSAVLMDIRMPVMDGLTASKAIRQSKHPDAKSVPIIAMSANAYTDDIQKSLDAGMNAHLAKPVDAVQMFKTLQQYIK